MVVKDTSDRYEDDDLIPSFEDNKSNIIEEDINRSKCIAEVLIEFENKIVPKMLELGLMKEIAKSRSKPYYNDSDQTMTAHILPGVEVMADVVEKSDSINENDFRKLVSLWTIHDLHKLIDNSIEETFEINVDTVKSWVNKLGLDEFSNDELDINDFHSCVVALHNSNNSKLDDSTSQFTYLRPHLRLVDAIISISSPDDFITGGEKAIGAVFGTKDEVYVPASHSIDMGDSIIRTILNKSLEKELTNLGLKSIDFRENGVLYARSENSAYGNLHDMLNRVIDRFILNLRDAYPIFRNQAFLGGDISSGDSLRGNWYMPTVYDITNLSKLCLNQTEVIQRIVQASVEQQNRPWNMSEDSKRQIETLSNKLDIKIPESSFIEGMATLVHTVYREILPELVDEESEYAYERTLESAIIHVFGVSEDTQNIIADSLENDILNSSITGWSYKYLIAHDLHKRYTMKLSSKERQKVLIELISTRLSDFEAWENYGENNNSKIKKELYILFASKIKLDGKTLGDYPSIKLFDYIDSNGDTNKCAISNKPTKQDANSPDLLSHRNIDVLNVPFVTENNDGEFEMIHLNNVLSRKPLSVLSQISLNIRAGQFLHYDNVEDTNSLYVTTHPVDSISVASQVRFNRILQYLKREMFSGDDSSIGLYDVANNYEEIIGDSLSQPSGVDAILNREHVFDIGTRMDESSSKLTLPNNKESTLVRGAVCATIASIMSGVRVCITKHPQLHMNHPDNKELVIYGPELSMFKNIIGKNTDITTLPQQLEVIERIVKMSDNIESPNLTLEQYNNICQQDDDITVVPGSIIYNQIMHNFDSPEASISAARDAINIDAIAGQNNEFARDVLQSSKKLGDKLGKILPNSDAMLSHAIMNIVYDTLFTMESINNTDDVTKNVKKCLMNITELNIETEDVVKGGSIQEFAEEVSNVCEVIESGPESFNNIRQQLISGTVVRSMIYATNQGDK
jgi:CRISPR type I-D-associated protein Csc3/Cas10d